MRSEPQQEGDEHGGGVMPAEPVVVWGTIKWFDGTRGFGFAVAEDPAIGDVLVHFSVLQPHGRRTLPEGARVEALAVQPAAALVDGNYRFKLPCDVRTVVGGDGLSLSIAAASILAKTARDRLMIELDGVYPGYGFANHKGYNAPVHQAALKAMGPCPAHRRSWSPIRALLEEA